MPGNFQILSITSVLEPDYRDGKEACVYGLGADGLVYYWDMEDEQWVTYSAKRAD